MEINVSGTEARVCQGFAARQQLGLGKYGVSVEQACLPRREWLQHALHEAMDLAVYLQKLIDIEDGVAAHSDQG